MGLASGWALLAVGAFMTSIQAQSWGVVMVLAGVGVTAGSFIEWRRRGRPALDADLIWQVMLITSGAGLLISLLVGGGVSSFPWVTAVMAAAAFAAGGAHLMGPRRQRALLGGAWGLALLGWIVTIGWSTPYALDVTFFVGQASEAIGDLRNPYSVVFEYPAWLVDALPTEAVWALPYPYLPSSSLLLSPWAIVLGDWRWGVVAAVAAVPFLVRIVSSWTQALRAGIVALTLPGTLSIANAGTVEPLLAVLAIATVVAAERHWGVVSVLLAGVLMSTKHFALLAAPALALWPSFGWRRMVGGFGVAALVMLPFVLDEPTRFVEGTILGHLEKNHILGAVSLGGIATEIGHPLPTWVSVLLVCVVAAFLLRAPTSAGETLVLAGVFSAVTFASFSFAFYQYYWLPLVLVPAGLAMGLAPSPSPPHRSLQHTGPTTHDHGGAGTGTDPDHG